MTHERLKIYFRQMQLRYDVDDDGNEENVIVQYDDITKLAKYVAGNVPVSDWQEMTDYTEGLEKISFSWDKVNQSSSSTSTNAGGSNYDKGISASLTFDDKAFYFIWNWLLDENWQVLNAIEVRITDAICKKSYRFFEIKSDNLKYSPADECRIEVTLREQDTKWHAIHKTFIWDDWQQWFNSNGTSIKAHPAFHTCIEPRPRILNSVRMALLFFAHSHPAISLVDALTGFDMDDASREILQVNKFCPSPLIRDVITNFCDKFGFPYDTLFTDPALPYYNLCLYFPSGGVFYEDNTGGNNKNVYLFDNRWNITVAELLDKLRIPFEAEWYITPNNTLIFKPLIELLDLAVIADFTLPGALAIDNLEYTFNGDKKAAYGRYEYSPDGSDFASQEIRPLYNDIVDYDGPALNPMLEGSKSKNLEFASTAFKNDGKAPDYVKVLLNDGQIGGMSLVGLLAVIIIALTAGVFSAGAAAVLAAMLVVMIIDIKITYGSLLNKIQNDPKYKGIVRLTSEQTMMPRLLLWDGQDVNMAKVVQTQNPAPNNYYNPANSTYGNVNKIWPDNPDEIIYNYPMYFDSMFQGNLYDRFQDAIDNPLKSLENNQNFQFTTDLCCEAMDIFGCWEGSFIRIGYLIKIEDRPKYEMFGRIENINISYDDFTMTIKGKVIKKKK